MRPLVILGAGGFGREVLDVVEAINLDAPTFTFLGFLDDGSVIDEVLARRGAQLLGPTEALRELEAEYLIGIGSPDTRRRLDQQATAWRRSPAIAIHPASSIGSDVRIGPGAVITAGSRLTTNITLGRHVHVNINSTIGHDCLVGDYVTINPGSNVSGSVVLEAGVTLGTGSAVIQGITVGHDTTVGAGAVVVRDLPPGIVAVGVPAKPLPAK